jgi:hypothetical protein
MYNLIIKFQLLLKFTFPILHEFLDSLLHASDLFIFTFNIISFLFS